MERSVRPKWQANRKRRSPQAQGKDPLGGFDRLGRRLEKLIITAFNAVLRVLLVGIAQHAIRARTIGIFPDKSPGDRHHASDRCVGVVESAEPPHLRGFRNARLRRMILIVSGIKASARPNLEHRSRTARK